MKKTAIYSFLILCCGILLACSNQKVLDEKVQSTTPNNQKVLDEKDQSTTPNKEEAVKAYIYAKNIELWESVFVSEKRYNEVAGKKICNDEEVELCRKVGKKICTYYFKESEVIEGELLKDKIIQYYSSLKYNIEKKTWETKSGREETNDIEKLVSQGKVESIGKIKVDYPNSYFPKAEISEYKKKILAEIKEYMEKYSSTIRKKGKYQIFIKDFSEADVGPDILVKNDEGKICVFPIIFIEQEGIDFSVAAQVNDVPEFMKDYNLGGINYSELFSKLSVEQYNYQESSDRK